MKFSSILFVLVVLLSPVAADEADGKKKKKTRGNNPTAQLMRPFKSVELSEEQKGKVETLAKETVAAMKAAREEAGITAEMLKKRAAAQKEMKAAAKDGEKQKPGELMKAVNEKAGFTETHAAGLKKANQLRQKFIKEVVAMMSDEQKANLPKQTLQAANRKPGKKGNAKKGKQSAEKNAK